MKTTSRSVTRATSLSGFTAMELLVAISVVMVLAGLTMQVMKNGRQKAQQVRAAQKIKDLDQFQSNAPRILIIFEKIEMKTS